MRVGDKRLRDRKWGRQGEGGSNLSEVLQPLKMWEEDLSKLQVVCEDDKRQLGQSQEWEPIITAKPEGVVINLTKPLQC